MLGRLMGGNCELVMKKHGISPSLLSGVEINTTADLVGEGFLWL